MFICARKIITMIKIIFQRIANIKIAFLLQFYRMLDYTMHYK